MICLITALQAEASALIDFFSLKKVRTKTLFPIYRNNNIALAISGIGKTAAAAATAYLYTAIDEIENAVWLNIGIAGHAQCDIGSGCIAHKITDAARQKSWYPPLLIDFGVTSMSIISVDSPETVYPEQAVYEMEACGFYAIASRASTAEIVHCYKIISDNLNTPVQRMRNSHIKQLIEPHVKYINTIACKLAELAPSCFDSTHLQKFIERWHFTATQTHQLQQLLQRYRALSLNICELPEQLSEFKSSNEVIKYMTTQLAATPLYFGRI